MRIFLAGGHGGSDPGAVANNTTEAGEMQRVVDQALTFLATQDLKGHSIVLVPHNLALEATVNFINQNADAAKDLCLEVHMNSNQGTPGTGTETYYGVESFARTINDTFVSHVGLPNRGVKAGMHLYFNNSTKPGSALLETGFINNISDLNKVRERAGLGLAKALMKALGLIFTTPTTPPPDTDCETKLRQIKALLYGGDAWWFSLWRVKEMMKILPNGS